MSSGSTSTITRISLFDTKFFVAFYAGKYHMNRFRKMKYIISIFTTSSMICPFGRYQQNHASLRLSPKPLRHLCRKHRINRFYEKYIVHIFIYFNYIMSSGSTSTITRMSFFEIKLFVAFILASAT